MNYLLIFAVIAAVLWLASLACGALSMLWSCRQAPRRAVAAVILAVVMLTIGYLGLQWQLTYSKTVNGRGWHIDSRWFFYVTVALGAAALALALWRCYKGPRAAGGSTPPKLETVTP
jgi:hypothetical protein